MISYCSSALNSSSSSIVGYFMSIPKTNSNIITRLVGVVSFVGTRFTVGTHGEKENGREKRVKKRAPSGIRTRVSRLGSVNANHYTNSALKESCPFGFSDSHGRPKPLAINTRLTWVVEAKPRASARLIRARGSGSVCVLSRIA